MTMGFPHFSHVSSLGFAFAGERPPLARIGLAGARCGRSLATFLV
jgi:hypothetical protein